jgi:hypothetical protein
MKTLEYIYTETLKLFFRNYNWVLPLHKTPYKESNQSEWAPDGAGAAAAGRNRGSWLEWAVGKWPGVSPGAAGVAACTTHWSKARRHRRPNSNRDSVFKISKLHKMPTKLENSKNKSCRGAIDLQLSQRVTYVLINRFMENRVENAGILGPELLFTARSTRI